MDIKLTQYSHGAGCGCKLSPLVLDRILHSTDAAMIHPQLLVGNDTRDDAAVLDIGNGQALISTTDFFMPIVDDPFDFGRIASVNAISDVYAMGGRPVLAIAILGWPIDKLGPEVASEVIRGARAVCSQAGIPLAGGHSIDSPEPIFGLAVNGLVDHSRLKQNSTATVGCELFLTKSLGVGILSTAEKHGVLSAENLALNVESMTRLNSIGAELAGLQGVRAMTDVTGFGLLGHLVEVCDGSGVSAELSFSALPLLCDLHPFIADRRTPGGTKRNWQSYGKRIQLFDERNVADRFDDYYEKLAILCDPQTSGGLLVAVESDAVRDLQNLFAANGLDRYCLPIGRIVEQQDAAVMVVD